MEYKYYYSLFLTIVFLLFGIVLFIAGFDLLSFHKYLPVPENNSIAYIPIILGFLMITGFIKELIFHKPIMIGDNQGIRLFLNSSFQSRETTSIEWEKIIDIYAELRQAPQFSRKSANYTMVLCFKIIPGSVVLPAIRGQFIYVEKKENFDEIIIYSSFGKNKKKIARELNNLRKSLV